MILQADIVSTEGEGEAHMLKKEGKETVFEAEGGQCFVEEDSQRSHRGVVSRTAVALLETIRTHS